MKKNVCLSRLLLSVLSVLAALVMASCTRHSEAWPQLLEAEKLLETDLPTAGAMLDSIDAIPLHGEDAALYAILKTQADYKRYLPLTSDSLPRLATDFYGTPYRKNYRAAMAWYSLGCYYTEQKDDPRAIESYLRAKDLYPDTLVRSYALCEQNLGKHYLSRDMFDEALQAFILYKNQQLCTSDSVHMSYADYFIGLTYQRIHSIPEAKRSFYSVLANPYTPDYYNTYSLLQLAKILYYEDCDINKSLSYLNMFTAEMDGRTSAASLALKGEIFEAMNLPDSAYHCFLRATQLSTDLFTLFHSYQELNTLSSELQRYDSLDIIFTKYTELSEAVHDMARQEEISRIQNDHTVELYKRKVASYIYIAVASFILILIVVLLGILISKKQKLQKQVGFHESIQENQQREMALSFSVETNNELEENPDNDEPLIEYSCLNQPLVEIRSQRIDFYKEHFRDTSSWKQLTALDAETLKAPKINGAIRNQILSGITVVCAGFDWELSLECNSLTASEILYCSCVMIGLTEEQILFLTDTTHRALITKKSRIRKKLSPEWIYLLFKG